jgi:hypothetical protein
MEVLASEVLDDASSDARPAHNDVSLGYPDRSRNMELVIVLTIIAVLLLLDVAALRYGADSRILDKTRPNW